MNPSLEANSRPHDQEIRAFMEPTYIHPCPQWSVSSPLPEALELSLNPVIFLKASLILFFHVFLVHPIVVLLSNFPIKIYCTYISYLCHAQYIHRLSHPSWFDHSIDIWRELRSMNLCIMNVCIKWKSIIIVIIMLKILPRFLVSRQVFFNFVSTIGTLNTFCILWHPDHIVDH